MMGNLWKFFFYSPKRAEALKEVQSALRLPELKIVKPTDTRWLSHERRIRAIKKEFPAIIITLQQLSETSGDVEAYGLSVLLASQIGVASVILLSEVLDILAKLSTAMQMKIADFCKLSILLNMMIDLLKDLKKEDSSWLSDVQSALSLLETEHKISIISSYGSSRSRASTVKTVFEHRSLIAIPYIDELLGNIKLRFSDKAVNIIVAMSVFSPVLLPEDDSLTTYGDDNIALLAHENLSLFYGNKAAVEYGEVTHTSPRTLLNGIALVSEWKFFKRVMLQEKKEIMKNHTTAPDFQELLQTMKESKVYFGIFQEVFKLINILLALPVGTATAERSFSQMKMIKNRLRNRLSDSSLPRLMKIAIEGPNLVDVDFDAILDIFTKQNRRIIL